MFSKPSLWAGLAVLLLLSSFLIACAGPAGTSVGTISGSVTNSLTKSAVAGVTVTTDPPIKDVSITTDNNGKYSATLPIGTYTLTFKRDNYTTATQTVSVVAGQTTTKDVALKPASPVAIDAGKDLESMPSATLTLTAKAEPLDGSQITGFRWAQTSGPKTTITNAETSTATVVLGDTATYKSKLLSFLEDLDRFEVQAINPHALTDAATATFRVTVTTSSGSYSKSVKATASLPYVINTGLQNVPIGETVLLRGKKQSSYNWTIEAPSGSKAALDNVSDRFPSFTPDVVGKYTLKEGNSGASIAVYAGTWAGAITGQDEKGRPLSAGCTVCHNGTAAADKFTDWKASGHAEIFTQNINDPQGHWAINCASCHTVGYNPKAKNNGFDEAVEAEGWKVPPHGEKGLWTTILARFPKTASLANIQCENCHGPNNGNTLHPNGKIDAARVSISSDVCGACHGEPPRHGRFQQWEKSGHGNFELAIEDATVEARGASAAHCGRCHSGQGFLAWSKQGDLTKQIQGAKGNATVAELTAMGLTKDTIQPQTCVVCHDPHKQGTTSGKPNTATVRITGNTAMLPAGFKAVGVGSGALCMTCHNTRNGAHNDTVGNPPNYSAPHTAAQADVLMGENAYFVTAGNRSKHSFVKDTCVTCHTQLSLPLAEFSFQRGGTNHSFKASPDVCKSCHGSFEGGTLDTAVEDKLHELGKKMADYLLAKIPAEVRIKDYTPHTYQGKNYDVKSADITLEKTNIASIEPTEPHGQQGFLFKLKNPVSATYAPTGEAPHTISIKEAEVQLGDITTDGKTQLIALSDPLVRAGWNLFLIEGDGSKGAHNPSFTLEVIKASISALK